MESLRFTKMNGAGNDFVVIDNRSLHAPLTPDHIGWLCDRHFGVGADGLLAAEPSDRSDVDYRMRYYNSDGSEAEMCGNGARCFARFVQPWPRKDEEQVRFSTPAGVIMAEFLGGEVRVNLTSPVEMELHRIADFGWGEVTFHSLNTGVPHVVVEVPDVDEVPVALHGEKIRHHALFPRGTNVNFVELTREGELLVRTYERGVEDETMACGTGVTAAALLVSKVRGLALPLRVKVRSGDVLTIDAHEDKGGFIGVTLTGPAEEVFTGTVRL